MHGEYKLWIYKQYLIQISIFPLGEYHIFYIRLQNHVQSLGMKMLKKWLGLTCSMRVAVINHPNIIGVPHLP